MTATVGTRELKTRLGRYLRLVRAGHRIVVTERGRPIAEITPIRAAEDDDEAVLRDLAALGKIRLGNGKPFPKFRPIRIKGPPLSQTIIEDREDRF